MLVYAGPVHMFQRGARAQPFIDDATPIVYVGGRDSAGNLLRPPPLAVVAEAGERRRTLPDGRQPILGIPFNAEGGGGL